MLENLCNQFEQLAAAPDLTEQELRRAARELDTQWKQQARSSDPLARTLEARFGQARKTIDDALTGRARSREADVWKTLAEKERLCEELDRPVCQDTTARDEATIEARWTALPPLPTAWEKAMIARRDAALHALTDPAAAATHVAHLERAAEERREILLEIELLLGLESPPELQAQRRAVQVRQLRDRFQGAASDDPKRVGEHLLAWCARTGVADARDRQRWDRIFEAMQRVR